MKLELRGQFLAEPIGLPSTPAIDDRSAAKLRPRYLAPSVTDPRTLRGLISHQFSSEIAADQPI